MSELNTGAAIQESGETPEIERLAAGILRFVAVVALLLSIAMVWAVRFEPRPAKTIAVAQATPELDREWRWSRPNEHLDGMYRGSR